MRPIHSHIISNRLVDLDEGGREQGVRGDIVCAGEVCTDSDGGEGKRVELVLDEGEVGVEGDSGA